MNRLLLTVLISALFFSCQKEIDWGLQSSKDGDLLVRAVEITEATNDTNTINLKYDAEKRLTEYHSVGKVGGFSVNLKYVITRQSNGEITRIRETTTGFIDSIIYLPVYSGGKLLYVITETHSSVVNQRDSITFSFNSSGLISKKQYYTDFLGTLEETSSQEYTYDATGNPVKIDYYVSDMAGGMDLAASYVQTFDSRKSPVTLGEESFIILEPTNVAKNGLSTRLLNSVMGQDLSTTVTTQTYTNGNRPLQSRISTTPQPPGYDVKVSYQYQ